MKLYLKAIEEKKFNKPVCKSFQTVKECLSDPFLPCQLSFFASQARQVELFLLKYQADKPLMPLLACDLQDMIQRLLSRFIKSKTLDSCSTAGRLIHLDVSSVVDHVQPAKIEQGLNTDSQLIKVKNAKAVSERDVLIFQMECKNFLIGTVKILQDKSPLKYSLVQNFRFLNPLAFKCKDACKTKMK